MADVTWANYKGILYPLDLEKREMNYSPEISAISTETNHQKSLVDLCAEKTVMDSTSTARALQVIPVELYYSLMRAALVKTRDRSIEVLISKWPWTVLSLKKLAPSLFDSLSTLYSSVHVAERMRRGVKYTTCLAHTFVECLKKRTPTKLKYLDLTGYPAAEVIVNYLSSHVLLVYNEARQKEIISLYNKVTHDWPQEQRHNYNLDTTLPDDTFVICVDAFVQTNDTHMELCRALKTSRSEACRFRMRVDKLDLTCLGVARISVLLEQVEPEHLRALCLQFNGLNNEGLSILGPGIQRFGRLTALDLSCNNIALAHEPTSVLLAETLGALPQLRRLDLSNNRVKNKLRQIISGIPCCLEYLKVSACGLTGQDLVYLTVSHHLAGLKELDLSENSLGRHIVATQTLLRAISDVIVVLEMEDCDIEESYWKTLFANNTSMRNLRFVNISRNNNLSAEPLMTVTTQLTHVPSLEVVQASYPVECYLSPFEMDVNDTAMEFFSQKLTALINSICSRLQRPPLVLNMKGMSSPGSFQQ